MKMPYSTCVVDIGSPKLGNIGWHLIEAKTHITHGGTNLDEIAPLITSQLSSNGLILGLEAPLFVPLREDLMLTTKARKGEGRRPWSAGAGAQVLAMNLPIMSYLFKKIHALKPDVEVFVNEDNFDASPGQIMIFEALVSGSDKGTSHIDDAQIMAEYCSLFSKNKTLPPSILEQEENTEFFNLASASLLRCGLITDLSYLHYYTPIYKPTNALL